MKDQNSEDEKINREKKFNFFFENRERKMHLNLEISK